METGTCRYRIIPLPSFYSSVPCQVKRKAKVFETENNTDDITFIRRVKMIRYHKPQMSLLFNFINRIECDSEYSLDPRKSLDSNNIHDAIRKGRVVERKS